MGSSGSIELFFQKRIPLVDEHEEINTSKTRKKYLLLCSFVILLINII
tara:strand:- start:1169 stop:1312 length:144 start_codon:yes stop_codon:yes gene_type:complete